MSNYDLYEAAGPRLEFLVLEDHGCQYEPEAHYISDWFNWEMWCGYDDFLGERQQWDEVFQLWNDIERCVRQANILMSLQSSHERALQVLDQHRIGLRLLYRDLKAILVGIGISFAVMTQSSAA